MVITEKRQKVMVNAKVLLTATFILKSWCLVMLYATVKANKEGAITPIGYSFIPKTKGKVVAPPVKPRIIDPNKSLI
ncbi:MAG: hypothetical protein AB7F28_02800 [Candidatus Margulisiibacteriota bacterium]